MIRKGSLFQAGTWGAASPGDATIAQYTMYPLQINTIYNAHNLQTKSLTVITLRLTPKETF